MKELLEIAGEKGFKKWFSDYSEKYHHLKGWTEYDEVQLPDTLILALLQKWLRELPTPIVVEATTDFVAWRTKIMHPDKGIVVLEKNHLARWFDSYEEALMHGLNYAITI